MKVYVDCIQNTILAHLAVNPQMEQMLYYILLQSLVKMANVREDVISSLIFRMWRLTQKKNRFWWWEISHIEGSENPCLKYSNWWRIVCRCRVTLNAWKNKLQPRKISAHMELGKWFFQLFFWWNSTQTPSWLVFWQIYIIASNLWWVERRKTFFRKREEKILEDFLLSGTSFANAKLLTTGTRIRKIHFRVGLLASSKTQCQLIRIN